MLNIVICEDQKDFLVRIKKCVSNIIREENLNAKIALTAQNPVDVLDFLGYAT